MLFIPGRLEKEKNPGNRPLPAALSVIFLCPMLEEFVVGSIACSRISFFFNGYPVIQRGERYGACDDPLLCSVEGSTLLSKAMYVNKRCNKEF